MQNVIEYADWIFVEVGYVKLLWKAVFPLTKNQATDLTLGSHAAQQTVHEGFREDP
jgi:hypothetical protein